jgi:hypothetical protein
MPASAAKIRVALQVVPPSLLSVIAAPISLLESFTGSFLHSAGRSGSCGSGPVLARPSAGPVVTGVLLGTLTFRSTDLAVSRIDRVGQAMSYDGRPQSNERAFATSG